MFIFNEEKDNNLEQALGEVRDMMTDSESKNQEDEKVEEILELSESNIVAEGNADEKDDVLNKIDESVQASEQNQQDSELKEDNLQESSPGDKNEISVEEKNDDVDDKQTVDQTDDENKKEGSEVGVSSSGIPQIDPNSPDPEDEFKKQKLVEEQQKLIAENSSDKATASGIDESGSSVDKKPENTSVNNSQIVPGAENTDLISTDIKEQSTNAIKELMKSVEKPNSDGLGFRNGTLVEDLVKELIKPELSSWLEKNLPSIVKNIVEREVKKLIPNDE